MKKQIQPEVNAQGTATNPCVAHTLRFERRPRCRRVVLVELRCPACSKVHSDFVVLIQESETYAITLDGSTYHYNQRCDSKGKESTFEVVYPYCEKERWGGEL